MELNFDSVKKLYEDKGYKFCKTGKLNVNIFGIRKGLTVDVFNDIIGIAYFDENNKPQLKYYVGTTDPGGYWLKNKLGNIEGTFILAPGYYPNCWVIGLHHQEYEALIQSGPKVFKGWRDRNSDGKLDMTGPLLNDVNGLNLHTTSHLTGKAEKVGAYSAGCQVMQFTKDHLELMAIVKKSQTLYGPKFSYALFENHDS